jgi:hypothetical protein
MKKRNLTYPLLVVIIGFIVVLLVTSCEKEDSSMTGPDFLTSHEFSLYQYTVNDTVHTITPALLLRFNKSTGTIDGHAFDWSFTDGLNLSLDFFVSLPTGYQGTNQITIEYDFASSCQFVYSDNTKTIVYFADVR